MKINIKVKEVTGKLLSLDETESKVNNLYYNATYSGDADLPEPENKRLIEDVASILYTFQQLSQRIAELELTITKTRMYLAGALVNARNYDCHDQHFSKINLIKNADAILGGGE